jgi:hypothetical protein
MTQKQLDAAFDGVDDYKQKKDQQINVSPFF